MSFNSEIMDEYLKIADETDMLGLKKIAAPSPNPYQEAKKTIEEKRLKTPEKNIIEIAHPTPVYVAEALGDGGLVENQNEMQKKLIRIINKMPTGSLVHRYASVIDALVKIADTCDQQDETQAAELLTSAAEKLLVDIEGSSGPFDRALDK